MYLYSFVFFVLCVLTRGLVGVSCLYYVALVCSIFILSRAKCIVLLMFKAVRLNLKIRAILILVNRWFGVCATD